MLLSLISLLPSLIGATPVPQKTSTGGASPCAQIVSALTPIPNPPPGSTYLGTVPAQLAYDCLTSIPVNVTAALELVRTSRPYLDFQSTIGFLKHPTIEYATKVQPPVDLLGDMDGITAKLQDGGYNNEYEVSWWSTNQFEPD
jgi:hypothetical protein